MIPLKSALFIAIASLAKMARLGERAIRLDLASSVKLTDEPVLFTSQLVACVTALRTFTITYGPT